MGKIFARITKILVIIVAVLVVCAILASTLIDPNKYKDKINNIVSKTTGRDFAIKGDIKWSIFPSIALYVQDAHLRNPKGFSGDFIFVRDINVKLKILPLIKREVVVKGIRLRGLKLNLKKDKNGLTNFDDFLNDKANVTKSELSNSDFGFEYVPSAATEELVTKIKAASIKEQKPFTLPKLNIGELDIAEATISWKDMQTNQNYILNNFLVKSKGLNLTKNKKLPPIKISGILASNSSSKEINFSIKAILNPVKQYLKFDPIEASYAGIKTRISTEVNDISKDLNLQGDLEILPFRPKIVFQDNSLPDQFSLKSKFKFKNNVASLKDIGATVDNGKFTGMVSASIVQPHKIDFDLNTNNFNIESLGQIIGAISAAGQNSAGVPNKSAKTKATKTAKQQGIIPVAIVKSMQVNGRLKAINTKLANNIKIDELNCSVKGSNGIIQASPIEIKIADSSHTFGAKLDVTSNTPLIEATGNAEPFEISKLVAAMGQDKVITGTSKYSLALLFKGNSVEEYKRSMSGATKFSINNGFVYGIDLHKTIDKALTGVRELFALIKGNSNFNFERLIKKDRAKYSLATSTADKTPFKQISATGKIRRGVIHNNDFLLLGPDYKATGTGTIDLPANKINYLAKVHLPKGIESDKDLEKILISTPIEVSITGPIEKPKITPNIESFVKVAIHATQKTLIKGFATKALQKAIGGNIGIIAPLLIPKGSKKSKDGGNKTKDAPDNPIEQLTDVLR